MSGSIVLRVASQALKDTAASTSLALLSVAVASGLANLTNKVSSGSFFKNSPSIPVDAISHGTHSLVNPYQHQSTSLNN